MRSPHLTVLSTNVRGLRTNIGDLTHNFILRHRTDIAVVTERWLISEGRLVLVEEGPSAYGLGCHPDWMCRRQGQGIHRAAKVFSASACSSPPVHFETHRSALVRVSTSACGREEVLCIAAIQEEQNPPQQDSPLRGK
ncbi:hypothetical protein Pcinc_002601 [Petrolisthes cinctipes]|uniref:Uncharacterized protein n=1 Tax=Petrolisthes cinctipes TaxID=88211 RepID=A0AAE1GKM0_PETCI|nr:hypothetical protein Pcinc_002601 [Petrolisthes cinctipes]